MLSEPEFAAAVRDALRDLARPDGLRDSPLLRSRLVTDRVVISATAADRLTALQPDC